MTFNTTRPRTLSRATLLLTLTALLSACQKPSDAKKNDLDAAPPKSTALDVQTVTAKAGVLSVQRTASGVLDAERDSKVAAQGSGTVQNVLVQVGQKVAAGSPVVQLDSTAQRQALENARLQVRQAQVSLERAQTTASSSSGSLSSSVTSAEAALAQAKQKAQSAENLYAVGGISSADLQAARSQLAQAQSTLAQAKQNLDQNGNSAQNSIPLQQVQLETAQAAVRQAEENLNRTTVRAPFAGTVADLLVKEGEYAAPGSALFRLVDPSSTRIKFSVPADDALTLKDGTTFNVGYGGQNYVATIVDSSGIAGSDRLVAMRASVNGGENLPVGATVQARYRTVLGRGILIPSSAVQADTSGNAVYKVESGHAHKQPINVIAESGGQVAVSGVQDGTIIINPVPNSLQDGAAVQVGKAGASK